MTWKIALERCNSNVTAIPLILWHFHVSIIHTSCTQRNAIPTHSISTYIICTTNIFNQCRNSSKILEISISTKKLSLSAMIHRRHFFSLTAAITASAAFQACLLNTSCVVSGMRSCIFSDF